MQLRALPTRKRHSNQDGTLRMTLSFCVLGVAGVGSLLPPPSELWDFEAVFLFCAPVSLLAWEPLSFTGLV